MKWRHGGAAFLTGLGKTVRVCVTWTVPWASQICTSCHFSVVSPVPTVARSFFAFQVSFSQNSWDPRVVVVEFGLLG